MNFENSKSAATMYKIFGNRIVSSANGNVLGAVVLVGYLAVNTLLFLHVSERLDKALRRVDKLELYIANTIVTQDITGKERKLNWLRGVKEGLYMAQTGKKDILRTRRSIDNKGIVDAILQRIKRIGSRLRKMKRKIRTNYPVKRADTPTSASNVKSRGTSGTNTKTRALFTIWGEHKCSTFSDKVQTGQMVTADGSDYLCLPDNATFKALRPISSRKGNIHNSVSMRGVTYGDIEDVISHYNPPPNNIASRNNKSVPCAVCMRNDKAASVMLVAQDPDVPLYMKFGMQREYTGILMSSKQSNKFVCVSIGAKSYLNKEGVVLDGLVDTVRLHPAELKCESLYCDSNQIYSDKHRVSCVVGTI